ncbi:MAG: dioxygenase [Acidimicrobiales bacterium]
MAHHVIEVWGLTKREGDTQALAGVDLAAPAGTVLGVLGPDGTGKTTGMSRRAPPGRRGNIVGGVTAPDLPEAPATGPEDITAAVVASFAGAPDDRLRFLVERLVRHLHDFVTETRPTEGEWAAAVDFLTAVGQTCTPARQEMVLLSDTLGVSMLVDLLNHDGETGATESTVLGPFYVPGSPLREMGTSIAEAGGSGDPARVSGTVLDGSGLPVGGALLDVWQNAASGKYAVQDPDQPEGNLRGRFVTAADGRFTFWAVRPTDYQIPDDGPVGRLLAATGRHPWRPAHLHLRASAPGCRPLVTHLFDAESPHLGDDTVFAVKPSLVCHYVRHDAGEPGTPEGWAGAWYTLERDLVLARHAVP